MARRGKDTTVAGTIRPSSKPVSDRSQLAWQEVAPVLNALVAQVNASVATVQGIVVRRMAELDGVDLSEGWAFNVDTMRWQQVPPGGNGAGG